MNIIIQMVIGNVINFHAVLLFTTYVNDKLL